MQPYESSDIGMYELERERKNKRKRLANARKDPELSKQIKHHRDCVHSVYLLGDDSWVYPCHLECELPE